MSQKTESTQEITEELAFLQVSPHTSSYTAKSPDHYLVALESTLAASQQELERLRLSLHEAQEGRTKAERTTEAVRTELINARSNFSLQVAEQRVLLLEQLETKVEKRVTESRNENHGRIEAAEKRCLDLENEIRAARKRFESERIGSHEKLEEVQHELATARNSRGRLFLLLYLLLLLFTIALHFLNRFKLANSHLQNELQMYAVENEALQSDVGHFVSALKEKHHKLQSVCSEAQREVRSTVKVLMETHYFAVDLREIAHLYQKILDAEIRCDLNTTVSANVA